MEEMSYGKVAGVLICFLGAVVIAFQDTEGNDDGDDSSQKQTLSGDLIALISSVGYGLYTTVIRYYVSYFIY